MVSAVEKKPGRGTGCTDGDGVGGGGAFKWMVRGGISGKRANKQRFESGEGASHTEVQDRSF